MTMISPRLSSATSLSPGTFCSAIQPALERHLHTADLIKVDDVLLRSEHLESEKDMTRPDAHSWTKLPDEPVKGKLIQHETLEACLKEMSSDMEIFQSAEIPAIDFDLSQIEPIDPLSYIRVGDH